MAGVSLYVGSKSGFDNPFVIGTGLLGMYAYTLSDGEDLDDKYDEDEVFRQHLVGLTLLMSYVIFGDTKEHNSSFYRTNFFVTDDGLGIKTNLSF